MPASVFVYREIETDKASSAVSEDGHVEGLIRATHASKRVGRRLINHARVRTGDHSDENDSFYLRIP
jgi:hypothetical protein